MNQPNTRPKGAALAVWGIYGFLRRRVVVGSGITPRDPHHHPFYRARTAR